MDITGANPDRIQLAMERFLQGVDSIELDHVCVAIWRGHLEISVASQWLPENVTEQTARADFAHAKQIFEHVADLNSEFRRRVATLPRRYRVVNDYGNGSVALCYLEGDSDNVGTGFFSHQMSRAA